MDKDISSQSELSPTERVWLAAWLLLQSPMSTREIAERLGVQRQVAWRILSIGSRVVPVWFDKEQGVWHCGCNNT